jgi:serine/threonine protein kinase
MASHPQKIPLPVLNTLIKRKFITGIILIFIRIDEYEKLDKLGEGTYGEVFKAKHSKTGDVVAIKKVRMDREKEGVSILMFPSNTSSFPSRLLGSCLF